MNALLAGIVATAVAVAPSPVPSRDGVEQPACETPSASEYVGPTLTVDEVEARSLKDIQKSPHAPQVAFGFINAKWMSMRDALAPGDTLHVFQGPDREGFLAMRGRCVIARIVTSID